MKIRFSQVAFAVMSCVAAGVTHADDSLGRSIRDLADKGIMVWGADFPASELAEGAGGGTRGLRAQLGSAGLGKFIASGEIVAAFDRWSKSQHKFLTRYLPRTPGGWCRASFFHRRKNRSSLTLQQHHDEPGLNPDGKRHLLNIGGIRAARREYRAPPFNPPRAPPVALFRPGRRWGGRKHLPRV